MALECHNTYIFEMASAKNRATTGIRTQDLPLTKRVLCQLSYSGITCRCLLAPFLRTYHIGPKLHMSLHIEPEKLALIPRNTE